MKWIGTDQGKEIVEVDGEVKAVDKAEFFELFPEHAPQPEATEEPAAEQVAEEIEATEEAKPKKGKTQ